MPRGACLTEASNARAGAVVFAVFELQFTKRGALVAELAASYNWAPDGEMRPLYEYRFQGSPLSPPSSEDGSPRR